MYKKRDQQKAKGGDNPSRQLLSGYGNKALLSVNQQIARETEQYNNLVQSIAEETLMFFDGPLPILFRKPGYWLIVFFARDFIFFRLNTTHKLVPISTSVNSG